MHKILTIVVSALLLSLSLRAQTHIQQVDSSLHFLDKSRISSGALYDRVYRWADLHTYNLDTLDYVFVRQAWYELYLSKYNTAGQSIAAIKNKCKANMRNKNAISVGYIDYTFQHIDSNAFTSGALVIDPNDSLPRDGDTTLYPYLTKNIVLPFIGIGHISEANPYFYFDPNIELVNASQKAIRYIKISNDIGSITLQPGERKSLSFSNIPKGKTTLRIEVSFDGLPSYIFPYLVGYGEAEALTHSVTTEVCRSDLDTVWSGSSLTFKGYDEAIATQGKGEYRIFYKLNDIHGTGCEKRLTKPLIIIDGFDPEDDRWILDRTHPLTGEYIEGIWDLLSYGTAEHFGDSLRLNGYDVIVLNFPEYSDPIHTGGEERDGGTDYIERNAMVLVKLIQNVNDSLVANGVPLDERELVIVGPSMGGQISRYALAFMEQQHADSVPKMNHNTRLWVSLDSPHQGANIPISVHQTLYFLGEHYNNEEALGAYNSKLRNPAARQMLIEQMDGLSGTADFHTAYYNNLNTNGLSGNGGYPVNLRKISLINGSSIGTKNNFPGQKVLELEAESTLLSLTGIAFELTSMVESGSGTTLDIMAREESFGFLFDMFLNITHPTSGMTEIRSNIFEDFLFIYGSRKHQGEYIVNNVNPKGSMDVSPGSTNNTFDQIKDMFSTILSNMKKIKSFEWLYNARVHTFIPSVSALDFYDSDFHWATRFDDRDLVCTEEIPFDNYFAPTQNEQHVSFSDKSAEWIMQEILFGRPGCPTPCATAISTTMPGTYMCGTDEYVFSIDVPFTAAEGSVEWTFSEGLVPVTGYISTNNNSIKLKWDGVNTPEERFVQARIIPKSGGTQCGSAKVLSLAVDYGEAFQLQLMPTRVTDPDFEMRVSSYHPTAYRYAWRDAATDPWPLSPTILYNRTFDKIPFDSTEVLSVRVYADGCPGYVSELSRTYIPIGLGWDEGDGPIRWQSPTIQVDAPTIAPNPTQDAWMLYLPQSWQATVQPLEITLVGPDGRTLHQIKTSSSKSEIKIPAAELVSGVYFIRVRSGDKAYTLKAVKL